MGESQNVWQCTVIFFSHSNKKEEDKKEGKRHFRAFFEILKSSLVSE